MCLTRTSKAVSRRERVSWQQRGGNGSYVHSGPPHPLKSLQCPCNHPLAQTTSTLSTRCRCSCPSLAVRSHRQTGGIFSVVVYPAITNTRTYAISVGSGERHPKKSLDFMSHTQDATSMEKRCLKCLTKICRTKLWSTGDYGSGGPEVP